MTVPGGVDIDRPLRETGPGTDEDFVSLTGSRTGIQEGMTAAGEPDPRGWPRGSDRGATTVAPAIG